MTNVIASAHRLLFESCEHKRRVSPPPGKQLRVCLDCGHRLIECSGCTAITYAHDGIQDSGWRIRGHVVGGSATDLMFCPTCAAGRP